MSLAAIHSVLYRIKNDPAALAAFRSGREQFVGQFELNGEERTALVSGDIPALWRLGVHPLLLIAFSRMIGVQANEYRRQLEPLAGQRAIRNASS